MAITRRVNQLSQMREDVPDLKAIESAASADFDLLAQSLISGASSPYVINGFAINMAANPIGGAASNLQVVVANGALLHTTASQSGTFYLVPSTAAPVTLNAATVSNVSGAFVPNANNYIGLDYYRFQDASTDVQRELWDPSTNQEDSIIAPAAIVLNYELVISSTLWASNILPIAVVLTDSGNNVVSITDARPLLFRLGTGGSSPNPFNTYSWPEGTSENPVTTFSNGSNPFYGGDKAITDLKDWIDAVETQILYLGGGPYWYSPASLGPTGSIAQLREDAVNTILTSNGNISHGVVPDTSPVLTTTGNVTLGSNQITSLASIAGVVSGQYITGEAFPGGTTVLSVGGSIVTMSAQASDTVTGETVSFTNPVATQPGQVNWSNVLNFKVISSSLDYQIAANPSGNTVTLADGQVAYISLSRDAIIAPNLIWTNGSPTVSSVGSISWTGSLLAGDWLKLSSATHAGYYKILTVDSASSVTLTSNFGGVSTGSGGAPSMYSFGTYNLPGVGAGARQIVIAARASVPLSPNTSWLLSRNDDGGALPRVYVRWLGLDLSYGVSENVSGPQIQNLLIYTGSQSENSTAPQYVQAYSVWEGNSNSVQPQIITATTGAASTMVSGQYWLIYSSNNARLYYVWVKKDGSGSDPNPIANSTGIEWDITTGQTNAQTAATLVTALNSTFYKDFSASNVSNLVTITNNSAGTAASPSNVSVGAPFALATAQTGVGSGNFTIQDGDNLTLGIKKLDEDIGVILSSINAPTYDEVVEIVASGATPPTSLNGPIAPGTNITLPNNTRNGNVAQYYAVGSGRLGVYLNGQFLDEESTAYTEVGAIGAPSNQIQIQIQLLVNDELEFRFSGSGGSGKQGAQGPAGPTGPTGPQGINAFGNVVSVSTKTGPYTLLASDFVILGDCTSGAFSLTLPTAAAGVGRIFFIKKIDSTANVLTIQANGAELIDGLNTKPLSSQWLSVTLVSNGTSWFLL